MRSITLIPFDMKTHISSQDDVTSAHMVALSYFLFEYIVSPLNELYRA